jgi:lambda family phage tail tape measure protein
MADDIVAIGAEIDASQTKNAVTDFNNVAKAADNAEKSINGMGSSADKTGKSMESLDSTVNGLIKQITGLSDDYSKQAKSLADANKQLKQYIDLQNQAKSAAKNVAAEISTARGAHLSGGASRELMVLAHEAASGNWSRLRGSAMVLGGQLGMGLAGTLAMGVGMLGYKVVENIMEGIHSKNALLDTVSSSGLGDFKSVDDLTQQISVLSDQTGVAVDTMSQLTQQLLQTNNAAGMGADNLMKLASARANALHPRNKDDRADSIKQTIDDITKSGGDFFSMYGEFAKDLTSGQDAEMSKLLDGNQILQARSLLIKDLTDDYDNMAKKVKEANTSADTANTQMLGSIAGLAGYKFGSVTPGATINTQALKAIIDKGQQAVQKAQEKAIFKPNYSAAVNALHTQLTLSPKEKEISQIASRYMAVSGGTMAEAEAMRRARDDVAELAAKVKAERAKAKTHTGISKSQHQLIRFGQLDDQMQNMLDSASRSQQEFVRQYQQRYQIGFRNQYQIQIDAVLRQRDARIRQARDELTRAERSLDDKVRLGQLTPGQAASSKAQYEQSFLTIQKGWTDSAGVAIASINKMDDASKDFVTGFDKGTERWFDTMSRTGDKAQQLSTQIFGGMSDTLTEFFTTGKSGWDDYITYVLKRLVAFEVQTEMMPAVKTLMGLGWDSLFGGGAQPSGDNSTVVDGTGGIAPSPVIGGGVGAVRKIPDVNINVRLSSASGGGGGSGGVGLSKTDMTELKTHLQKSLTHEINKQILKANRQGGINRRAQGHN